MQPITSRVNASTLPRQPTPQSQEHKSSMQEPHASSATSATHGNTAANSQTVGGRTPGERETEADDTNTATDTAPSTSSQDPLAPQANQSRDAEDYVSAY